MKKNESLVRLPCSFSSTTLRCLDETSTVLLLKRLGHITQLCSENLQRIVALRQISKSLLKNVTDTWKNERISVVSTRYVRIRFLHGIDWYCDLLTNIVRRVLSLNLGVHWDSDL